MINNNILVDEWMSHSVTVAYPNTLVGDAYNLMMERGIRRLPVVDLLDNGRLVGIVTLSDLREARPSSDRNLSIYKLNYLLSKLTVQQVMTHNPYTITCNAPIQDAARIMFERKVSALPVVDEEARPIGIITESDIFRMLLNEWNYFTTQRVDPGLMASLIAEQVNR